MELLKDLAFLGPRSNAVEPMSSYLTLDGAIPIPEKALPRGNGRLTTPRTPRRRGSFFTAQVIRPAGLSTVLPLSGAAENRTRV